MTAAERCALPTLGDDTFLQLKVTPRDATVTVLEIYAVSSRVVPGMFIIYERLLLLEYPI